MWPSDYEEEGDEEPDLSKVELVNGLIRAVRPFLQVGS